MIVKTKHTPVINPTEEVRLPFALPIVEGKKMKKKCCKKYKKSKRCKKCPANF